MNHARIEHAVHNNAVWCDTVCRAHGRPGEFLDGIWINRQETPPFYPNAVTLSADRGSAAQLAHLHDLVAGGIPGEWGVKDSFCILDLSPLSFRNLFEAEWIYRPAALPRPEGGLPGVRWVKITGAAELANWEMAWAGEPTGEMSARPARIFLPSLLANENIAVIAAYQEQRIVAGVIASRTGEVVGLSNLFVPASDPERFRAGCVARVIDAFPGWPLVGYEAGRDLAEMRTLDFEVLGPLRIWVRVNESG
jgi:hypothetical protein